MTHEEFSLLPRCTERPPVGTRLVWRQFSSGRIHEVDVIDHTVVTSDLVSVRYVDGRVENWTWDHPDVRSGNTDVLVVL